MQKKLASNCKKSRISRVESYRDNFSRNAIAAAAVVAVTAWKMECEQKTNNELERELEQEKTNVE